MFMDCNPLEEFNEKENESYEPLSSIVVKASNVRPLVKGR